MTDSESAISSISPNYKQLLIKKNQFQKKQELHQNADEYLDLISFSLLKETYGIALMNLKEILKVKNIEKIPQSPPYLLGILNLRGTLVTVVHLKKRLGFDSSEINANSRIIIVEYDKRPIGFLVDKVNEIIRVEKSSIVPPPQGIDKKHREFIEGIGESRGQEIILPRLSKILTFD